ncbi:MAG: hypothetical protein CR966_00455 [Pseudomonadales bacterium]|nr:MAG: hypothetical protein CR966_00455 [Pseudomonadales bacterium]
MKNKLAQLINYAYVYGKHKATTLKWLLLFMIFVMGVSFFPRYGMIYLFAPMAEPTIYYTWLFGFGFLFVAYYFKDFEEVNTKISTKRLNTREIANSYPTELMSLENKVAYLFVAITSLVLFPIFYTLLYLTVFALSNWLFKMFWDYQQLEWFVPFAMGKKSFCYKGYDWYDGAVGNLPTLFFYCNRD